MKIITENKEKIEELVVEKFKEILSSKPDAVFAFDSSEDLMTVYNKLGQACKNGELSFASAKAFVVNEFYELDSSDEHSIHSMLQKNLFADLDFAQENIYYPCTCSEDKEELKSYDEKIEKLGGIDFVLLGIGINGSLGFNEPATPFESFTHSQLLTDKTKESLSGIFGDAEIPEKGITMGIKTIMLAKQVSLVAFGEEKANIIRKMVYGKTETFVPASMLQIHMDMTLFLDEAAGSNLD